MLEESVNEYGQEQIIDNFDKIIKIGNKFLQVRLIRTKKWRERHKKNGKFTEPMPRAKFVNPEDNPYYLIRRDDLIDIKNGKP
jgi:hypothetical protein